MMQCFKNAPAYISTAVSYKCKMVMKLTPEERLWRQQLPQEFVNLLPLEGQDHGLSGAE
jgi:hypothetical protein